MQKYALITDSCSDLPLEIVNEIKVEVIPLTFMVDGKIYHNYSDEREMTTAKFYEMLRNKKTSSTSQLNPNEFEKVFKKHLDKGEDVLYIAFSSALSGTCQSAKQAAETMKKEYPDREIRVIDSLAASMGEGLLVWYAAKLRKEGKSLGEVASWLEENKLRLDHLFTVDDLFFLKRGGRLSVGVALIGSLIGIKPLLHVSVEGKLVQTGIARGKRQALNRMVARMMTTIENQKNQEIFISHGDCQEDADYLREQVKAKLPDISIIEGYIGPVIGSHSGPGTIAIYYLGNDRL